MQLDTKNERTSTHDPIRQIPLFGDHKSSKNSLKDFQDYAWARYKCYFSSLRSPDVRNVHLLPYRINILDITSHSPGLNWKNNPSFHQCIISTSAVPQERSSQPVFSSYERTYRKASRTMLLCPKPFDTILFTYNSYNFEEIK